MKIISARHVLPITSEPIEDGAVAVDHDRIVAIGMRQELNARFPTATVDDLGNAAILPGFVNCHSHLELTALRGALDAYEHDFSAWLLRLNSLRASMTADEIGTAATAGAIEGARAGVTCFGDIGRMGGAGLAALKEVGLRGVIFQETEFSADGGTSDDDFRRLREKYSTLQEGKSELVEVGLSPHSPYTVSRRLFEKIARFAADEDIKVTIHTAESPEEDELMRNGTGFFTSVYEKFGVRWETPRCSSVKFLSQTGILENRPLLAHCITVSDDDIDIIAASGSKVAHCPKSNAKFGHGHAPLERLIDADIPVGLGSDSVASNNLGDLLEESRAAVFAARNRQERKRMIMASDALKAATIGGARALGLEQEIGSLEPGKDADLIAISLCNIAQQPVTDIHAAIVFSSKASDVILTMVAGREVYRNGHLDTVDEEHISTRLNRIAIKTLKA